MENNFIYKENDVAANVVQRESSKIKRYASAFNNILIRSVCVCLFRPLNIQIV